MAAEEHALTSTEYIKHHLTNMTYGKMPDGTWKLAESAEEAQQMVSLLFTWIQWVGQLALVSFSVCCSG